MNVKGIIITLTEEEFDEHVTAAVKRALENFSPSKEEIIYLTRKQVAKKLHISLPTLNEYTKTGKLKGYRINGRVLYKKDEIDNALTSIEPLKYSGG
jgi:excisionase family DNA binding protein